MSKLGVDISKPFEAVSLGLSAVNKPEEYFAWYVVFGKCVVDYAEKVDDLSVYRQLSHPRTDIDEEHFVLEVFGMKFK